MRYADCIPAEPVASSWVYPMEKVEERGGKWGLVPLAPCLLHAWMAKSSTEGSALVLPQPHLRTSVQERDPPYNLTLLAQRTTPPLPASPNPGPHFVGSPLIEPSSNYPI